MSFAFKKSRSLGGATVLACSAVSALATGFDLPDQDAFAVARGMAFVATADNASAIYYNPAGISQLPGDTVRGGIYSIYIKDTFTQPNAPYGNFQNEKQWHAIPTLFYTHTFKKLPLSVGLGLYSPFGLSSAWPQDTGFRTISTSASLKYWTINPVLAWQICPTLSVGAGPTINYGNIDLQQGVTPAPNNDGFSFKGDDWAAGFNAGALWRVHPKVSLGVSYRSATTMNYQGHTDTYVINPVPYFPASFALSQTASASMPTPQKVISGISYRPTPAWNLEFNADWTDWDRLGTVNVQQATPVQPLVLDWKSSWYFELGGTHYFDKVGRGWTVSAGYIYNQNSVPDAHYAPSVADLNRQFISLGTGHKGEHFDFDVAYQCGFSATRTVTGSAPSAWGQTADGQYKFMSQAVFLTVGWRF